MLYLRICFDREDAGPDRERLRAEHRAYLTSSPDAAIVQAGPMCRSDADDTNIGSFLIIEAADEGAAQRFHDGDPFTKAGLYATSYVHRWDKHIG